MAQRVDFHFNVPNRYTYACRLVRKARSMNLSIAVWARDAGKLEFFSRQLWSFDPTGFYPHVHASDPLAAETPIVYANDEELLPARDVLVLLDDTLPNDYHKLFERFNRVFDVVPPNENEKIAARERFKFYRHAGLNPIAHDQGTQKNG